MTKSRLLLTLVISFSSLLASFPGVVHGVEGEIHTPDARMDEANTIAYEFIQVLPMEAQSSIGLKDKATRVEPIFSGYTDQVERKYEALYQRLVEQEFHLSPDPFLKKEMAFVKGVLAHTLELLRLNKKYGRVTIFLPFNYSSSSDAIDPVSYIFDSLSSLIIQKYPPIVVGKRFAQYVEGDGENPPFIEGVEQEVRTLLFKYKGQSILYPCQKQLDEILDEKRLKSVLKWIREHLPEEQQDLLPLFERQIKRYENFVRQELLPYARQEARLPEEIYLTLLKLHGVHDHPDDLIERAHSDFEALYSEYVKLAAEIAEQEKLDFKEPVKVLQYLESQESVKADKALALYQDIQSKIEDWIKKDNLISLPEKPMTIRLGNEAEEAIMPVPHVNTPYFIDNDGSVCPEFVLCDLESHGNPLVAFPLTAHEGHPGHVLQFGRMLEDFLKGKLDLIQVVIASNSTNCEGWAHYVEYLMRPYFEKAAQLSAIRDQLLRSARLFLDPELNLGKITFNDVVKFFQERVGFSENVAVSEAERYSYRMPAQATTYRYGCLKIIDARDNLQRELGSKFTLKKFHDTFISFGLLPIDLTIDMIKEKMLRS